MLQLSTFLLFIALLILLSQLVRLVLLQRASSEDLAHLVCFSLMVPMTVSPLLHNPTVKIICTALALLCSVFFVTRFFYGSNRTRTVMHIGMSLGMAAMYLAHHNLYLRVIFGVFYLCFFLYYFRDLLKFFSSKAVHSQNTFSLQAKFSHFLAGLAMFAMFFWR